MKRLAALLFIAAVPLAFVGIASASTSITWVGGTGNGSDNLPCADGAHWVLSPAQGITSATLAFDGHTYDMVQSGEGSFSVDTPGPVGVGDVVTVSYEGQTSTSTSTESTPPETVKGESHTRTPGGGGGSTGGTGGTAFTGSDGISFMVIAAALTTLGLVSLYIARRRAARLES
jgi:hypothetical protein